VDEVSRVRELGTVYVCRGRERDPDLERGRMDRPTGCGAAVVSSSGKAFLTSFAPILRRFDTLRKYPKSQGFPLFSIKMAADLT
jgi:hypothetical protein